MVTGEVTVVRFGQVGYLGIRSAREVGIAHKFGNTWVAVKGDLEKVQAILYRSAEGSHLVWQRRALFGLWTRVSDVTNGRREESIRVRQMKL